MARASVHTPTLYPRPTWAYYEPEQLWRLTVQALRAALAQVDETRLQQIAGIAVTSMGEAGVPLDAHGQPTYDAIAWFDRRTQAQVAWLEREVGRERLFEISGLSLQPIFSLCKLLWLKANEPDAFARTVRWLNIADYIAFRLSGEQATDYSLASRTLALDLRRRRWAADLMRHVGIPPAIMAPLAESGTALGSVTPGAARETGLPPGTVVAAGGHDHVCGAFATGVTDPGSILNSLGTAEALFLPLPAPIMNPALGAQGYTQGAHVVADRYYAFGGQYTSGASIEWARDLLGGEGYAPLIAEAATAPPGSLGVVFLPHLRFANPPIDDPHSRGAFLGLSSDVGRGALFRAVLEGLAYESRLSLEPLLAYTGAGAGSEITAIGGVTRNRLLMQIKATVLNRPFVVAGIEEATTLGAAMLGGIGAGIYTDADTARRTLRYARSTITPIAELVPFYDRCFHEIYEQLYRTLRPLSHKLADLAGPHPPAPSPTPARGGDATDSPPLPNVGRGEVGGEGG